MATHDATSISYRFHQETKYAPGELDKFRLGPGAAQPPEPFKEYQAGAAIDLTPYLPFEQNPFTGKPLAPVTPPEGDWGLAEISRLLYFTNGVTAMMRMPDGGRHLFRAAPSAGALYPTELYLTIRDLPELPEGIYNYQVNNHTLVPVWEGAVYDRLMRATFNHSAVTTSQMTLIMTGLWERGLWRYRERAYRRCLLDTGHVFGNLSAIGPGFGFGVITVGGFHDASLNELLFLDDSQEAALVVAALPRLDQVALDQLPRLGAVSSEGHLHPHEEDLPLHLQLHRGAYLQSGDDGLNPSVATEPAEDRLPSESDEIIALDHNPLEWHNGIESTILARRSCRRFLPEAISLQDLSSVLSYAYQPVVPFFGDDQHPLAQMFDPSLLSTYLLVLRVDDLTPGLYFYDPVQHELQLERDGELIELSQHICLGQELGRDAAVLVVHTFNLSAATARYGDRAYRYLHMDAGYIGQYMSLAAQELGLGISGIGGFFDDEVTRILGLSANHGVAYITTLGMSGAG